MYIVCIYKNNICQFKNILPLHHNTLNMVASYIHNQLIALAQHQTLKTQFFLKRRFFPQNFAKFLPFTEFFASELLLILQSWGRVS